MPSFTPRFSLLTSFLWALALVAGIQAFQTADSTDLDLTERGFRIAVRQTVPNAGAGTGTGTDAGTGAGTGVGTGVGTGGAGSGTGTGIVAGSSSSSSVSSPAASTPPSNVGMTVMPATCLEYSRVANYSTIGLNSTLRANFQQLSPHGTDKATSILDTATQKLPRYKFNVAINARCGNLSEVAAVGAAANFSQGIVAEYSVNGAVGGKGAVGMGVLGMGLLVSVGMMLL